MAAEQYGAMIEELLAAGRAALRCRLEGDTNMEHQALEFMDSLWDRMSNDERENAIAALRKGGLDDFAGQIEEGRRELGEA